MNKLKNVFKKQKRYLIIGLLVVTAIIIFLFTRAKNNGEIYTVSKTDVMQSVVLSGKVQTSDRADLGFASAGRVNKIM